jgi:hypothetical protein
MQRYSSISQARQGTVPSAFNSIQQPNNSLQALTHTFLDKSLSRTGRWMDGVLNWELPCLAPGKRGELEPRLYMRGADASKVGSVRRWMLVSTVG